LPFHFWQIAALSDNLLDETATKKKDVDIMYCMFDTHIGCIGLAAGAGFAFSSNCLWARCRGKG
jgi:hypothetical protein